MYKPIAHCPIGAITGNTLVYFLLVFFLCIFYIIEIILHIQQFSFLFPHLNTVLWALTPHHGKFPSQLVVSSIEHLWFALLHSCPPSVCATLHFPKGFHGEGQMWLSPVGSWRMEAHKSSVHCSRMPGQQNQDKNPGHTPPPIPDPSTTPQETQHTLKCKPPVPPVKQTQTTTFNYSRVWKHPRSRREVEISSQNEGRMQFC